MATTRSDVLASIPQDVMLEAARKLLNERVASERSKLEGLLYNGRRVTNFNADEVATTARAYASELSNAAAKLENAIAARQALKGDG